MMVAERSRSPPPFRSAFQEACRTAEIKTRLITAALMNSGAIQSASLPSLNFIALAIANALADRFDARSSEHVIPSESEMDEPIHGALLTA